jgi:hypothetical protein
MAVARATEGEVAVVAVNTANALASASDPTQRATYEVTKKAEMCYQSGLLRCIFANPFRPAPSIEPNWLAWNDRIIPRMASTIYEERSLPSGHLDPARLAVLADALEEVGCSDAELLGHLRGPGPHVRGCFAVDAVLGKS